MRWPLLQAGRKSDVTWIVLVRTPRKGEPASSSCKYQVCAEDKVKRELVVEVWWLEGAGHERVLLREKFPIRQFSKVDRKVLRSLTP